VGVEGNVVDGQAATIALIWARQLCSAAVSRCGSVEDDRSEIAAES
jgi:hypothetical protein